MDHGPETVARGIPDDWLPCPPTTSLPPTVIQHRSVLAWSIVLALIAVSVWTRINNALRYPTGWGFDALGDWQYIERLLGSWTLPSPESGWSTAHPPLFYYASAALLRATDTLEMNEAFLLLRLWGAALGLLVAALAAWLVRRLDPGRPRRALLAAGLLLFLPVHIYISAMLTEEMLLTSLSSLVVCGIAASLASARDLRREIPRAIGIGLISGLALLTKLSAAAALLAAVASYAWGGWRQRSAKLAVVPISLMLVASIGVGGWYYINNHRKYGQLFPHDLAFHRIMYAMPPGERELADYVRFPLATWTDPQLLSPELLRSVWGSTYVTVWYDGHRHFLPRQGRSVQLAGTALLLLGLVPTFAFGVGLLRGVRRLARGCGAADAALISLTSFTLAGYAAFTWRNPWFATVKGSYLLMLSIPFSYYTSEVLDRWCDLRGWRAAAIWSWIALLAIGVTLVFTYGWVFAKSDPVGLPWRAGF